MGTDVFLGLFAHPAQRLCILVKFCRLSGKILRFIGNPQHILHTGNSLCAYGSGNNGGAVIDGLHHLALYACAVTERNHHHPALCIQPGKLLLRHKALHDNAVLLRIQGLDFLSNLGTHHIKDHMGKLLADQREDLSGKPENAVCVGRMGEASHKEKSFPLCKILLQVLKEVFIYIGGDGLYRNGLIDPVDGIHLHLGRIIRHGCLVHHGQLDGAPVV